MKKKLGKVKGKKKLKTFVLLVSKKMPMQAPFVAKQTGFKKKILDGTKIHTIRANKEFWKKRIDQVNKGEAVLSIRQWTDIPYRSAQKQIKKLTKLGYQEISISRDALYVTIDGICAGYTSYSNNLTEKEIEKLANNDGLTLREFNKWFKKGLENGCIIHFTNKRYNPQAYKTLEK